MDLSLIHILVENQIRQKEGERILKYVKEDAYVITLEIGGSMLDSVEFSKKIQQLGVQGKSHIIFIIGGSIGLGTAVLKRSDYAVSFSKMTFPHQLMRVILLEQIYRGYRIAAGEPYHKDVYKRQAFDEEPTTDSQKYTGPIAMPKGEHTFSAIAVDKRGKVSPVSSAIYVYYG